MQSVTGIVPQSEAYRTKLRGFWLLSPFPSRPAIVYKSLLASSREAAANYSFALDRRKPPLTSPLLSVSPNVTKEQMQAQANC